MYKLIYVDEQPEERRAFSRAYDEDFELTTHHPQDNIDDCLDYIINEHFDGVVTDFKLNEHDNIHYTGTELIDKLLEIREGFPVFILTGYPNGDGDPAIDHVTDVNIIYNKDELTTEKPKTLLKDKILKNIKNYKLRITESSERLNELIEKNGLTLKEESELLKLDGFIERALDKETALPDSIKREFINRRFDDLISLGNEILKSHKKPQVD